ncbi:hypothetical protein ACFOZ1_07995 [Gracilibacillus marinus]|uniref:CGNR zinc finger domain-containing protein n=1 Tax=Gracilibacillus marinus TaxID=630535 RepID=A0ABV8VVZ1_9BACI
MLLDIIYRQVIEVPDEAFDVREGYPGSGALAFHRHHVAGLPLQQSEIFIRQLYNGELEFITDNKRVKNCAYCGFYWYDESTRNNAKLCSESCRKAHRALQKAEERGRKPKAAPEKLREIDYYIHELEYAYWRDEKIMQNYIARHERLSTAGFIERQSNHNLAFGEGNRQGNRRRGFPKLPKY